MLAFVLRVANLGGVPPGVSHDELESINNGISIFATGRDLAGDFLSPTVGGLGLVALPAYIAGLGATLFGRDLAGARAIAAILGTVNVFFIYLIAKKLVDKRVGVISAFLAAVSPWAIIFSRIMYDPPMALFFALLAITILLYAIRTPSIIAGYLVLGFSAISYYGLIFTLPLVFLVITIYRRKDFGIKNSVAGAVVFASFYVLLFSMISSPEKSLYAGNRVSEIIFLQPERISQKVDFDRSRSVASGFVDRIFINKPTVVAREIGANYLSAFSPENLFLYGEDSAILSPENTGFMYFFELPLIAVGAVFLFRKKRTAATLVFTLVMISPVTMSLANDRTFAARCALMFPLLIILAGAGLSTLAKTRNVALALTIFYIAGISSFVYEYFGRYPVYASDIWFTNERRLTEFVTQNDGRDILISTIEPRETFMEYMFYSKMDPVQAQKAYRPTGPIFIGDNIFITDCTEPIDVPGDTIMILDAECGYDLSSRNREILSSEGANHLKWAIFNF